MPHIQAVAHVTADADALWKEVGSFQRIGDWHPMLKRVEGEGEEAGAIRKATGRDGSEQVERLKEIHPAQRYYRYEMISTAMPVSGYMGELRVHDNGDGTSTVSWSSDFAPTSDDDGVTITAVRGFLKAGLENLKRKYDQMVPLRS